MACSVLRSDFDAAGRPHAVVVGGLGWHGLVTKPLSFSSSGGIRLSTVLSACAQGAGQAIAQPTDHTIGDHYELAASKTGEPIRWSDALNDLMRAGIVPTWRVDPDGVTRFSARTATAVTARATLMRRDSALGLSTYGLDAPAGFLPGNTVDGVPIGKLVVREHAHKLEADVYSANTAKAPPTIREMLRRIMPDSPEHRASTYNVAAVHADGTLDLSPNLPNLPEIKNCEQWTVGGIKYTPAIGTSVVVLYRDSNKTSPIAFAFELANATFAPVAAVGDQVQVFFPPTMPITGLINGVTPFTGVLTVPGPGLGTVQTGSSKVGRAP